MNFFALFKSRQCSDRTTSSSNDDPEERHHPPRKGKKRKKSKPHQVRPGITIGEDLFICI